MKRVLLAATALATGAGLFLLVPGGPGSKHAATTARPACVVIKAGNGLTIQLGYAPNGPGDCTQL
jgi:hypothetical protein